MQSGTNIKTGWVWLRGVFKHAVLTPNQSNMQTNRSTIKIAYDLYLIVNFQNMINGKYLFCALSECLQST